MWQVREVPVGELNQIRMNTVHVRVSLSKDRLAVTACPPRVLFTGMSVFVAFFVLLLLLADSTPPAAQSIPLIGIGMFYPCNSFV